MLNTFISEPALIESANIRDCPNDSEMPQDVDKHPPRELRGFGEVFPGDFSQK